MFTGTVVQAAGLGCWLIEQDLTRDCIFVHQRHVLGRKFLHVNDRVRFNLTPNSRRPGEMMADEVEIFGLMVARQTSGTARKVPNGDTVSVGKAISAHLRHQAIDRALASAMRGAKAKVDHHE